MEQHEISILKYTFNITLITEKCQIKREHIAKTVRPRSINK